MERLIPLNDWQGSLKTVSGSFIPGQDKTALFYSPAEIKHWNKESTALWRKELEGDQHNCTNQWWMFSRYFLSQPAKQQLSAQLRLSSWGALLNECYAKIVYHALIAENSGQDSWQESWWEGSPDGRCPAPSQRLFRLVTCCRPQEEYHATWHLNIDSMTIKSEERNMTGCINTLKVD